MEIILEEQGKQEQKIIIEKLQEEKMEVIEEKGKQEQRAEIILEKQGKQEQKVGIILNSSRRLFLRQGKQEQKIILKTK